MSWPQEDLNLLPCPSKTSSKTYMESVIPSWTLQTGHGVLLSSLHLPASVSWLETEREKSLPFPLSDETARLSSVHLVQWHVTEVSEFPRCSSEWFSWVLEQNLKIWSMSSFVMMGEPFLKRLKLPGQQGKNGKDVYTLTWKRLTPTRCLLEARGETVVPFLERLGCNSYMDVCECHDIHFFRKYTLKHFSWWL